MSRPAVVIVAGWGQTQASVAGLEAALAPAADVVATSVAEIRGPSGYAEGLLALLAGLREPAWLIGWSMGGMVALEAAAARPALLRGLILISSTARFCTAEPEYMAGVQENRVHALRVSVMRKGANGLRGFYQDFAHPEPMTEQEITDRAEATIRLGMTPLTEGLLYLARTDLRALLPAVRLPTLIVHGTEDRIVPMQAGEFLHAGIAGSRWVRHENSGHMLIQSRPELPASDILPFIAG